MLHNVLSLFLFEQNLLKFLIAHLKNKTYNFILRRSGSYWIINPFLHWRCRIGCGVKRILEWQSRSQAKSIKVFHSLITLELAAAIYRYNWAEAAFFQHTPKIHVAFMFGTQGDILFCFFYLFIYMMIIEYEKRFESKLSGAGGLLLICEDVPSCLLAFKWNSYTL